MNALKKLLIALLVFSLQAGASHALDREKIIFREALSLYTTGQYSYAFNILKKIEKSARHPKTFLLLGYLYELEGNFQRARSSLSNFLIKGTSNHLKLYAATEKAAIEDAVMDNTLAASITLDLAGQRFRFNERDMCILLFNSYLLKRKLGISADKTFSRLKNLCYNSWILKLIPQNMWHMQNQTPTQ